MQSIEARQNYKNSFECAARIFKDEGILTFWSGAVPRLVRLILSGGIVFTMYVFCSVLYSSSINYVVSRYEKTMEGLDTLDPQRKYV
jgi:solute carrier family 25 (mitochondrial citrate transporter), member 1